MYGLTNFRRNEVEAIGPEFGSLEHVLLALAEMGYWVEAGTADHITKAAARLRELGWPIAAVEDPLRYGFREELMPPWWRGTEAPRIRLELEP